MVWQQFEWAWKQNFLSFLVRAQLAHTLILTLWNLEQTSQICEVMNVLFRDGKSGVICYGSNRKLMQCLKPYVDTIHTEQRSCKYMKIVASGEKEGKYYKESDKF